MLLNIQAVQLARAGLLAGSLPLGASFLQAQTPCPPSGASALESGWRAYRADSLPKAIRQFELAQRLCPDNLDAEVGVGFALLRSGNVRRSDSLFRSVLARSPSNSDAWEGRARAALRLGDSLGAVQAGRRAMALAPDNHELRTFLDRIGRSIQEATRPATEGTANWSNDSDHNTSFWQTLSGSGSLGTGVGVFGSVNALEASDPTLDATRVGGEAGVSLALGRVQLSGAAGARRLVPEVADPRTAATYRGRLGYRPIPGFGLSVGYSRFPFDEIASLMERNLDLELLEGGFDAQPSSGLTVYAAGSGLWLSDGNNRTGVLGGFTQKLRRRFSVGLFGRTLSYERRGVGYFSPDRFSVLEATASYSLETGFWTGNLGGGLGAQQVGERGAAQSEWHIEGRLGRRWGVGNRVELFGMVTNSAVSSTTGAFRYRSAGLTVRLGL